MMIRAARLLVLLAICGIFPASALAQRQPDWAAIERETIEHFQALLRFDTSDPPGVEKPAADYLKAVLEREGIPVEVYALDPNRPNIVARLKGNGSKRPLLIMGHTDVVNVDAAKWRFAPFSAMRDSGYVYGRGAVDDKDNVVAGLMVMLMLKRLNIPLDRDVIFLAEAGEEGSTRYGIQLMVNQHFSSIDAEYCFAEGGGVTRRNGRVQFASVQTLEKIPRAVELVATGPAGHGSVPLQNNAISQLSAAVAAISAWRAPVRLNQTTTEYFRRLVTISSAEDAERYRAVLSGDPVRIKAADDYFAAREPRLASTLRTSVSPNIIQGGYRVNVIPSEARATLDVRMLADEDTMRFLETLRGVIRNPAIQVRYAQRDVRPATPPSNLQTEALAVVETAVRKHYDAVTLPTMSTGATDMAYLRAKGIQCYGVGPATDVEDGPRGFGAHSDQERILESELHRFVRFHYDIVADLARRRTGA